MIIKKKRSLGAAQIAIIAVAIVIAALVVYRLLLPWRLDRAADNVMKETPAFQEIARWEPAVYAKMKAAAAQSIQRGDAPGVVRASVRWELMPVVKGYIPKASDEALVEYWRVSIDAAEQIAAKAPDVAFAMLISKETILDVPKYVDEATEQREAKALAEIVRTGVANEAGHQNDQRARRELDLLKNQFVRDYGADGELVFTGGRRKKMVKLAPRAVLGVPQPGTPVSDEMETLSTTVEKPRTAEMAIAFHRRVLELRPDVAAQVIRYELSK